ncbi:hypothetical protein H4W33_000619 [Kibdelosporangium phytohabitans]|uniref:Uncharacterized protein n=1 Tax=Kibdelosporangium phytohabitans TaxID=860235 RepID=A0A0N9I4E0_9PSEU|nr:hypothetical protein AOZ06_29705 [Kibdelosporangium phytohabitans]MBE1461607.1 hypothetical protein [Kibdelosporangium phytohabitans]
MRTVGVDLAAEPVNTAIAVIEWRPSVARVVAAELPGTDDSVVGGVWMIEYHATTPASDASASVNADIDPTSNRSRGCTRWATSTMAGERSTPNTSSPSPARYPVIRPGPQPRSATGAADPTKSANMSSTARSHGFAARASRSDTSYEAATVS